MNNDFEKKPVDAGVNNDTASEAIVSNAYSEVSASENITSEENISVPAYETIYKDNDNKADEAEHVSCEQPKSFTEPASFERASGTYEKAESNEANPEGFVSSLKGSAIKREAHEQPVSSPITPVAEAPEEVPVYAPPYGYAPPVSTRTAAFEGVPPHTANTASGDFSYTKTVKGKEPSVGYVWDSSAYASAPVKKKGNGTSGFKVFVAVMLGVFTLSAVTIAAFLAVDHMTTSNAVQESNTVTENNYAPTVQIPQSYQPVSTFTEDESGLTKTQVAAKCQPSAVGIVIEQEQSYNGYSYNIPFFGDFGYPGGTQIIQGSGSGFIFSADGYIITNHHVIENANKITVYLHDGTTAEAELIGSDSLSDIAVIKIDAEGKTLIPIEIGDSSIINVGDEVIAIGCPAGIEFMGTVTDGIISAINRDVELDSDSSYASTKTMTLLQTNATINRGNSGGPLINSKGQVIGINTLKLSADYEGIGFSIPINGALPIINQLIEHGKVVERSDSFVSSEGVIGISASEITEYESEYYDIPMGLLVVQIDKDSSASKAGLRRGDIITKFNGTEVRTVDQLNKLKYEFKAGDEVTITIFRESVTSGEYMDITFKLDMAD